jgi:hypothetical protein
MVKAVAVLKGDSNVAGVITFTQEKEGAPVTVSGDVGYISLHTFPRCISSTALIGILHVPKLQS